MYNTQSLLASQYSAFIGIDWADQKHDFCVYKENTMESIVIENNTKTLQEFFMNLLEEVKWQKIAVIIESNTSMLTYLLAEMSLVDVYQIHPTTASKYRETFAPSKAKNDSQDAKILLDLWFKHEEKMSIKKTDEHAETLKLFAVKRREIVNERTALSNALTALLKISYPGILDVFSGSLYAPININFLQKWPDPTELNSATKSTLSAFFNKHSSAKHKTAQRMELIEDIRPVILNKLMQKFYSLNINDLIKRIEALNHTIKQYEVEIDKLYKASEFYEIFNSLPGAGAANGPRIMAFFGNDLGKFPEVANALQASEIAPVLMESGKMRYVRRRYLGNRFHQQTFIEFAEGSLKKCAWAQEFYKQKKENGKSHFTILRALAFKWIRIIYRCWQTNTPYSEDIYLNALKRKKSKLIKKEVIVNDYNKSYKTA